VNDAMITVVGWVAQDPRFEILESGTPLLSLRIGSTPRRYDRELGQWRDDEPMFLTANCWRALADNLQHCGLKRGDPVIVTGRLRIREYSKEGQRRFNAQVEATTVGHDLSRGIAKFQRSQRTGGLTEDRRHADDVADRWLTEDSTDLPPTSDDAEDTEETSEPLTAAA
jgi:single stranded DNA-binding protein